MKFLYLSKLFPDNIKFYAGMATGDMVAAVVVFVSSTVWHAQYIASNDMGRNIGALDFLFEHLITQAMANRMSYFSFGTSDEPKSGNLNAGLCQFKHEFGGGGGTHMSFSLMLSD